MVPTLLSTLAPLLHALYRHRHLVSYHRIHHHIKYGGGEQISLYHTPRSMKHNPIVSACLCFHFQPPPIRLEEPPGSGAHAVPFQDLQSLVPVQSVIHLVQVQEDHVQDLLLQGR